MKFLELNKKIVIWHCLCHRLELAISDAKASSNQFSQFQEVFNKIYKFYSTSSTNCNEIKKISSELDKKFKKIGKIFTIRWSASSYNTVCAVLNNLDALKNHFSKRMILCKNKDKKQEMAYILENLRSPSFVKNLEILQGALKELTSLSCQLQKQNLNMVDAHKILINSINIFKITSNISAIEKNPNIIDKKQFYAELAKAIKQRSIATAYKANMTKEEKRQRLEQYMMSLKKLIIVDKDAWPSDYNEAYGDEIIPQVCKEWSLDEIKVTSEFRDFKLFGKIGDEFQKLVDIANTFCISSADAERGFSLMNLIMTDIRNKLKIETTSNLMIIRSINVPLSRFKADELVKTWLTSHNSAGSSRNINRSEQTEKADELLCNILF